VVALLAVVGLPAQRGHRAEDGHGEDLRGVAAYLAQYARSGDAVLYSPFKLRVIATIYPGQTAELKDVALAGGPVDTATINGVDVDAGQLPARLSGHARVWLVHGTFTTQALTGSLDTAKSNLPKLGYQLIEQHRLTSIGVDLYRRPAA
jgi:hypothetical protein